VGGGLGHGAQFRVVTVVMSLAAKQRSVYMTIN